MKHVILSALALAAICFTSIAQEHIGLSTGNYSGVNRLYLNPANNVYSPVKWDLTIVGAAAGAYNNYAFFENTNFLSMMANKDGFQQDVHTEANQTNAIQYDFYGNDDKKFVVANAHITLPSIMLQHNQHSFGFYTRTRSQVGYNKLNREVGYHNLDGLAILDELNIDKFSGGLLNWTEIAINYGRPLLESSNDVISGGITLKYNLGHDAVFANNRNDIVASKIDANEIEISAIDFAYGYTGNLQRLSNDEDYDARIYGTGLGIDLGATWQIFDNGVPNENFKKSRCSPDDKYRWKFGAALMDIGYVKFKDNAQKLQIKSPAITLINDSVYEQLSNIESFDRQASLDALGQSLASANSDKFTMLTPAALTLSADRRIGNNFYVNALMVRSIKLSSQQPARGNVFALTPRFETGAFGFAIPVSVVNEQSLNIGASINIGPLTIGSDGITNFFGKNTIDDGSIYAALHINPSNLGFGCPAGSKGKRGGRRDGCPTFK